MIYRVRLSCRRMIRLLAHPSPLSQQQVVSFSGFLRFVGRAYWRERGWGGDGRGAKSYDRCKAWSSINYSILSGVIKGFKLLLVKRSILRILIWNTVDYAYVCNWWESNINVWIPHLCIPRNETVQPCDFQNRIRMFCLPISTLIYLWEIYIFPGSVCLFCCNQLCGPILGTYKSLIDTWI
jgi:hypothetical protein